MWPAPSEAVWATAPWKYSPVLWGSVQSPTTVLQPEHRGCPGPHCYGAPGAPEPSAHRSRTCTDPGSVTVGLLAGLATGCRAALEGALAVAIGLAPHRAVRFFCCWLRAHAGFYRDIRAGCWQQLCPENQEPREEERAAGLGHGAGELCACGATRLGFKLLSRWGGRGLPSGWLIRNWLGQAPPSCHCTIPKYQVSARCWQLTRKWEPRGAQASM